jgi:predicted ArsR family transcriptional regulator
MSETVQGQQTTLHRALADERRSRIVEELHRSTAGLDANELALTLGLHPNTVRWHLGVLTDAGLVEGRREDAHRPGRPRTLYSLCANAAASGRDEFRLLASVLTSALGRQPDAAAKSEAAGRDWGRYLAPRRSPLASATHDEAIADAVRLLDEQGFAPEAKDGDIRLRRCPYLDLAEQHPEVVCSVHKGLLAGALERLDVELEPFVEPNLCRVRLRPTA